MFIFKWRISHEKRKKKRKLQLSVMFCWFSFSSTPLLHKCRYINGTFFMILLIKQTYLNTPNFNFTEFVVCTVGWIASRVGRSGSVVVIDDVSAMRYAGYIDMIRYRISCVAGVFETEKTVFLGRCIRYINRESKESTSEVVDFVYKRIRCYTFKCTTRMAITFVSAFIVVMPFYQIKYSYILSYVRKQKIPVWVENLHRR